MPAVEVSEHFHHRVTLWNAAHNIVVIVDGDPIVVMEREQREEAEQFAFELEENLEDLREED